MDPYQPAQPIFESDESSASFTVLRDISGILNNRSAPDFDNLTFSTNHHMHNPPQAQQYTSHTQNILNTPTNSFLMPNHANISIPPLTPTPAMSPSTPLQSSTPLPSPSISLLSTPTPIQNHVRMVPDIYDLSGKTVDLKRRKTTTHQQPLAPAEEHGGKAKRGPRCTTYQTQSGPRSKSRYNNTHGLLCKMQDLKTTTHDESFLTIYQNYGAASQTKQSFSTVRSLVTNCTEDVNSVVQLPTVQELATSSPSKSRKKRGKYVCQLCGIEWER